MKRFALLLLGGFVACSTGSASVPIGPQAGGVVDAGGEGTPDAAADAGIDGGADAEGGVDGGPPRSLPLDRAEIVVGIVRSLSDDPDARMRVDATIDGQLLASDVLTASAAFPHETRFVAGSGQLDRPVLLHVSGLDASGAVVLTRTVATKFVPGRRQLAPITLEPGSACLEAPRAVCDEVTETCISGRCTSADIDELPEYAPDWATSCSGDATGPSVKLFDDETEIVDGATIQLHQGYQGGVHVFLTAVMQGFAPSPLIATYTATQTELGVPATPASDVEAVWFPDVHGQCHSFLASQFRLDVNGDPADVAGHHFDVTLELKDTSGHAATVTRRVFVKGF